MSNQVVSTVSNAPRVNFCSNCGARALGNFCAECGDQPDCAGARCDSAGPRSLTALTTGMKRCATASCCTSPKYGTRSLDTRPRPKKGLSGEDFLKACDLAFVPLTGTSLSKIASIAAPIYSRIGIRLEKKRNWSIQRPIGKVLVAAVLAGPARSGAEKCAAGGRWLHPRSRPALRYLVVRGTVLRLGSSRVRQNSRRSHRQDSRAALRLGQEPAESGPLVRRFAVAPGVIMRVRFLPGSPGSPIPGLPDQPPAPFSLLGLTPYARIASRAGSCLAR